nr:potassium transporter TrkG [Thalassobacillus sp. C254]
MGSNHDHSLERENQNVELIDVIFETSSAFGTCGLSTGITADLSMPSQIILLFLMFVGRVGILVFLFSVKKKIQRLIINIQLNE